MVLVFFGMLILAIVLLLMLLVFGFTLRALGSLLLIPGEFADIVSKESVRRNHALKHATMNVIEERLGRRPLGGQALKDGFTLEGAAPLDVVLSAAREGLSRLKAGELHLAVYRRCGPTIATGAFLCAVLFLGVLLGIGRLSLLNVALAVLVADLLGPRVSKMLQRLLSSFADVSGLRIVGLAGRPLPATGGGAPASRFEVRTAPGAAVLPEKRST
jgi:hypothetical protein